ncbi:parkin co-regulated protein-domain-containing protein [Baffinella frigidus]|nr:parkin co-regulated protein-domain-containing protein [Cryptophyta sp. CCMP2293]
MPAGHKSPALVGLLSAAIAVDRTTRSSHRPSRTSSLPPLRTIRHEAVDLLDRGQAACRRSPEPAPLLPRVRGATSILRGAITRSLPAPLEHDAPKVRPSNARKDDRRGVPLLRRLFDRGDFPATVRTRCLHNDLLWTKHADALDYDFYLPILFEGLLEKKEPYKFLARRGILDLAAACPLRILANLPKV